MKKSIFAIDKINTNESSTTRIHTGSRAIQKLQ